MAEPLLRPADPGTVDAENPWPGLASFREADRELFYGRESETQDLLRLTLRERLTVLFGLSGLGKTSLLRAGLFPLLRQENVLPVSIRLDFSDEGIRRTLAGQIREAIGREAAAAEIEAPAFPDGESLWESLHRQGAEFWSPRNRIVTPLFVLDQFEEVFTLGRGSAARAQETEAFLAELADLCEGSVPAGLRARLEADPAATRELSLTRHPYKILLSLREDFLPELEGLRGRIRSIVHNRFRLRRMNGGNALRVVTEAGGHLVEPDVPERIVRFVAGREGDGGIPLDDLEIEPALLSVVCRELNNKRRAQGLSRITAGLVQGNRDEILSDLYERSVEDLGPEVRSFIEERLLTKSGFRDSVARENVIEVGQEALDKLTDRRLLRVEDRGGMQRLELTHDVLTGVIRKSRDERRQREAGEREEAARREAERKLRRSRWALALLGLVLVGVAALAAWGFTAQKKAGRALASSYLERATSLQDSSPAHALAYLAQAIREEPESVPAQSLLAYLLLYTRWPRPLAELQRGDAEWTQLSDDGRFFLAVSGGGDRIHLWDAQTLRKIGEIEQSDAIRSVEISRDGRFLLVVSPGKSALWDTRTGKSLWRLASEEVPRLSPDGRWLAWIREPGPSAKTLVLRDNSTRREREIFGPGLLGSFGFSPDSRRIFKDDGFQVSVRDLEGGRSYPASELHGPVRDVVFSPDSRHLLFSGFETTILWNPEERTEKQIADKRLHGWVASGGARAATYDSDSGEVRIWNTGPASPVLLAALPNREVYEAEFSPDGRRFLTTSEEGVELWNADSGRRIGQSFCECLHAHFLPETGRIVTGDDDGILRVWSPEPTRTGTQLYGISGGAGLRSRASLDGRRLAIQTGSGEIHLWDMDAVRQLENPVDDAAPSEFALSPDGRFLDEQRGDILRIWDLQTRRLAWPPLRLPAAHDAYRVHREKGILAVRSRRDTVELWRLATGRRTGEVRQDQAITNFDFTPGGDLVTSVGSRVFLWSSSTGTPIGSALGHGSSVTAFDLSPDGRWIATGTEYGLVRVRDLLSGQALVGPLRHRDRIDTVQFDPRGRILLTRARNLVRLWDARTGRPRSSNLRSEGSIWSAQLGAYGARILINAVDRESGRVRLLEAQTGQLLFETSVPPRSAAQLSSNGQILWIASGDQVRVFVIPHFPREDRELLARWAEAVGGWAIDEDGQLMELSDQLVRLETLRRDTAGSPPGSLRAASLIRWFLAGPAARPVSPVFERTLLGMAREDKKRGTGVVTRP